MLAAAIIVFREILEAGLIIGIVLAVTRNVPGALLYVAGGVLAGLAGSAVVAIFTGAIASTFAGTGQDVFNAAILAIAVVMLAWHNIWMARHGREMAAELKSTGEAVSSGSKSMVALMLVIGVAVLREGSEVVLFLYGIVVSGQTSWGLLLAGSALGVVGGAAFSSLTYFGLLKIPARRLFAVTGALIAVLAAGMAAQSVSFLEQAGVATVMAESVWNTGDILSDKSILGQVLHTLIGYSDQPSQLQLLTYIVTLITILGLMKSMAPPAHSPTLQRV